MSAVQATPDVVVENAEVVTRDGVGPAAIWIRDGRILRVAPAGTAVPDGARRVDAGGRTVLPGVVDTHVHFRSPAHPERETFLTGSAAAASGGVTTVLEMPTSDPTVTTGELLTRRAQGIAGSSYVDYALYGGAGTGCVEHVESMALAGAVAFKTFLHRAAPGREHDIGPITATTPEHLLTTLRATAATGLVSALHCEDDSLLHLFQQEAGEQQLPFGACHAAARPLVVEDVASVTASLVARSVGARIHFVHTSSPDAVDLVDLLRRRGLDASIETAPHYLSFTEGELREHGPFAKCNPPLRAGQVREGLIERLRDGLVDNVASDHCPYTREEIEDGAHDPLHAPAGLPGIEYLLPRLLTLAAEGTLSLPRVAQLSATVPAERFGLVAKGEIAPGKDADLVFVDTGARWEPSPAAGLSMGAENARYLAGHEFVGRVAQTWVRGVPVHVDGRTVGDPGHGRWLPGQRYRAAA